MVRCPANLLDSHPEAKGLWKVPTEAEARLAQSVLERANATDTTFIVVERPLR